ncbi:hypothetical protein SAMN05446635_6637 [Burkholderia sp. OK233]|nr:hypothetical protein SAMN05446635_6637 [Burkholderia sp. OK233]
MSRGFVFATTSDFNLINEIATSVCKDVVQTEMELNCYCDSGSILISAITSAKPSPVDDFRDSLDLFSNRPVNIPLEELKFFYGQIIGNICCANRLFVRLDNLMMMINFPGIILYKNIAPIVNRDNCYDWYDDEKKLTINPDLF